jgi:V8-like Glu-specific endopeptidase
MWTNKTGFAVFATFLVVTTLTVASPAHAAPVPAAPADDTTGGTATLWDPARGTAVAGSDVAAGRILDAYWTPERMATATPATAPTTTAPATTGGATRAATRPASTEPETIAAYPVAPGGTANRAAVFANANGKVFFRNATNGGNFVCTASAINSGSKRLVLTAGHCVHGGQGGTWHQNWVFVPGYNRGARPLGTFPASAFRTFDSFIASSDYTRDIGFVVTGTNSTGATVVSAAGGHGFAANAGTTVSVNVAGYPVDREGGEAQLFCTGTTRAWSTSVPGSQIDCGFSGGASGGPWLRDAGSNGLGIVVSETMGLSGTANYGPAFDNTVLSMYNAVRDQT